MVNKNNLYDVTIVVCNYNPNLEKVKKTIDSYLLQKNVKMQIVVSDDGSKETYFDEIEEYFLRANFEDFILLDAKKNEGTVKNILKGVIASKGEYVKFSSPGDCIKNFDTLRNWIDAIKKSGKRWSFSDAIYYQVDNNVDKYIKQEAHPQMIEPYLSGNDDWCRWNYVALGDIALGAATLCERELFLEYLKKIDNHVVYAEDNAYRLMMFDGVVGYFYPNETVYYEYGVGVSTCQNDVWNKRLANDWNETNRLMIVNDNIDKGLQEKIIQFIKSGKNLLNKPYKCRWLFMKLYVKFHKRYTKI